MAIMHTDRGSQALTAADYASALHVVRRSINARLARAMVLLLVMLLVALLAACGEVEDAQRTAGWDAELAAQAVLHAPMVK